MGCRQQACSKGLEWKRAHQDRNGTIAIEERQLIATKHVKHGSRSRSSTGPSTPHPPPVARNQDLDTKQRCTWHTALAGKQAQNQKGFSKATKWKGAAKRGLHDYYMTTHFLRAVQCFSLFQPQKKKQNRNYTFMLIRLTHSLSLCLDLYHLLVLCLLQRP